MTWEDKSALSMERALLRALRDLHATKAASFTTVNQGLSRAHHRF